MCMTELKIYTDEFREYKKLMRKKMPRAFAYAAGYTLNDLAFGTREEGLNYINQTMIVRNKAFVRSRLYAQRAKFSEGIDRMESIAGSLAARDFTGWREQITGEQMARGRAITKASRGGSVTRRVRPSARLRSGTTFTSPKAFRGRSQRERANTMLQTLDRDGNRNPFILYGHRTLSSGLWKFGSGRRGKRKLILLQLFGKSARVRRDNWIEASAKRFIKANPIGRLFAQNAAKSISKITLK